MSSNEGQDEPAAPPPAPAGIVAAVSNSSSNNELGILADDERERGGGNESVSPSEPVEEEEEEEEVCVVPSTVVVSSSAVVVANSSSSSSEITDDERDGGTTTSAVTILTGGGSAAGAEDAIMTGRDTAGGEDEAEEEEPFEQPVAKRKGGQVLGDNNTEKRRRYERTAAPTESSHSEEEEGGGESDVETPDSSVKLDDMTSRVVDRRDVAAENGEYAEGVEEGYGAAAAGDAQNSREAGKEGDMGGVGVTVSDDHDSSSGGPYSENPVSNEVSENEGALSSSENAASESDSSTEGESDSEVVARLYAQWQQHSHRDRVEEQAPIEIVSSEEEDTTETQRKEAVSETPAVERETAAVERETAAVERETAAVERETAGERGTEAEREGASGEREAAAAAVERETAAAIEREVAAGERDAASHHEDKDDDDDHAMYSGRGSDEQIKAQSEEMHDDSSVVEIDTSIQMDPQKYLPTNINEVDEDIEPFMLDRVRKRQKRTTIGETETGRNEKTTVVEAAEEGRRRRREKRGSMPASIAELVILEEEDEEDETITMARDSLQDELDLETAKKLQAVISNARWKVSQKASKLRALSWRLQSVCMENERLRFEKQRSEDETERWKNEASQLTNERQTLIARHREQIENMEKTTRAIGREKVMLEAKLATLNEETDSIRARGARREMELMQQLGTLREELRVCELKLATETSQNLVVEKNWKAAEATLLTTQMSFDELQTLHAALQSESQSMHASLAQKDAQIDSLSNDITMLRHQLQTDQQPLCPKCSSQQTTAATPEKQPRLPIIGDVEISDDKLVELTPKARELLNTYPSVARIASRLAEYQNTLDVYRTESSLMRAESGQLRNYVSCLEPESAKMAEELERLRLVNLRLESELDSATLDRQKLERANEELQTERASIVAELASGDRYRRSLQNQLAEAMVKLEKFGSSGGGVMRRQGSRLSMPGMESDSERVLSGVFESSVSSIADLIQENDDLKRALESMKSETEKTLQIQRMAFEKRIETETARFGEQIGEFERNLAMLNEQKERSTESWSKRVEILTESKNAASVRLAELRNELELKERELNEIRNVQSSEDEEKSRLKVALGATQDRIDGLTKEMQTLRNESLEFKLRLGSSEGENEFYRSQLDLELKRSTRLKEQIDDLQIQLGDLMVRLKNEEREKTECLTKIDELNSFMNDFKSKSTTLELEKERLNGHVELLEHQMLLMGRSHAQERNFMEGQNQRLETWMEKLRDDFNNVTQSLKSIKDVKFEFDQYKLLVESEKKQFAQQINALNETIRKNETQISSLEVELGEKEKYIKLLRVHLHERFEMKKDMETRVEGGPNGGSSGALVSVAAAPLSEYLRRQSEEGGGDSTTMEPQSSIAGDEMRGIEIMSIKAELVRAQTSVHEYKAQNDDLQATIASLEENVESVLKPKVAELESELKSRNNIIELGRKTVEDLKLELVGVDELREKLRNIQTEQDQMRRELETQLESERVKLKQEEIRSSQLQSAVDELKQQSVSSELLYRNAIQAHALDVEKIKELQLIKADLTDRVSQLMSQLSNIQTSKDQDRLEFERYVKQQEAELNHSKLEIETLRKEIQTLNTDFLNKLNEDNKAGSSESPGSPGSSLAALRSRCEAIARTKSLLQSRVESLTIELQQTQIRLKSQEATNVALHERLANQAEQIAKLERDLNVSSVSKDVFGENARLSSELSSVMIELKKSKSNVNELQQQLSIKRQEHLPLIKSVEELKSNSASLTNEIERLKASESEWQNQYQSLLRSFKDIDPVIYGELKVENKSLKEKITVLMGKLEDFRAIGKKVTDLKTSLDNSNAQLAIQVTENENLKKTIADNEVSIKNLAHQVEQSAKCVEELRATKVELGKSRSEINQYKSQLHLLESQVNQVKNRLTEEDKSKIPKPVLEAVMGLLKFVLGQELLIIRQTRAAMTTPSIVSSGTNNKAVSVKSSSTTTTAPLLLPNATAVATQSMPSKTTAGAAPQINKTGTAPTAVGEGLPLSNRSLSSSASSLSQLSIQTQPGSQQPLPSAGGDTTSSAAPATGKGTEYPKGMNVVSLSSENVAAMRVGETKLGQPVVIGGDTSPAMIGETSQQPIGEMTLSGSSSATGAAGVLQSSLFSNTSQQRMHPAGVVLSALQQSVVPKLEGNE